MLDLSVEPVEEVQSDGDDFSVQDESGTETTEGDGTVESSGRSSPGVGSFDRHIVVTSPDTPTGPKTKASHIAATRGLNINVSERGNRHSRILGLPASPRPTQSPTTPMHTPR
jgi:RalA-binding protein 1